MATPFSPAALDELKNLEVVINGERLFWEQRKTLIEKVSCRVMCGAVRLIGLALLIVAVVQLLNGEAAFAINVGMLGLIILISGLIGFRNFQNAPRRLTLDTDKLEFVDTWTGQRRTFPRTGVIEARCGKADETCAVYLVHPNGKLDLLIDQLPRDLTPHITQALNDGLRAEQKPLTPEPVGA